MPPKSYYTDPKLRDKVKEEIKQSDKGGEPGQWSARKAQMMAQEYKRRGGDYTTDKSKQDEDQKNLEKWTEEEWQTKEGSGHAQKSDGTQKRYLPKKAWEKMTEDEKQATDEKKQEESKEGKQYVGNTQKAKEKRKKANQEEDEHFEKKQATEKRTTRSSSKKSQEAQGGQDADGGAEEEEKPKANTGQKRKSGQQQTQSSSKKQKSNDGGNAPPGKVGSKHMDATEPAPRGSADRLPKKNQKVTWKAMPGYVDGTVQEILTKGKSVDGKSVKASKDDPKIVLKSSSSGKICVHKPESCFYE